jgi:hypothetical protein
VAIEQHTEKQISHLIEIAQALEDIKMLLTPNGNNLSGTSPQQIMGTTMGTTASRGSSDYGAWAQARHGSNASRQILHDGLS